VQHGVRERRVLRDQVWELLAGLGTGVGAVAASLEAAGVRGVRGDGDCCVLASYLHAVLGGDDRISHLRVGDREVEVVVASWRHPRMWIPFPPAVREFVWAFDTGMFPRLTRHGVGWPTPVTARGDRADGKEEGYDHYVQ